MFQYVVLLTCNACWEEFFDFFFCFVFFLSKELEWNICITDINSKQNKIFPSKFSTCCMSFKDYWLNIVVCVTLQQFHNFLQFIAFKFGDSWSQNVCWNFRFWWNNFSWFFFVVAVFAFLFYTYRCGSASNSILLFSFEKSGISMYQLINKWIF